MSFYEYGRRLFLLNEQARDRERERSETDWSVDVDFSDSTVKRRL